MSAIEIDTHTVGDGDTQVLVIHGSGSAAKPFMRLGQLLCEQLEDVTVTAISLAGYGSHAANPRAPVLEQHLAVLRDFLNRPGDAGEQQPWHLIGHSMGGFLALQIALTLPRRVATLALIEPIALGVLDEVTDREALQQDRAVVARFAQAREQGKSGVNHFIEAWNQAPWAAMPDFVRAHLVSQAEQIYTEVVACSADTTALSAYAKLRLPILLLAGQATLLPARRVVETLAMLEAVDGVRWVDGAKHMAVVQQPELFAGALAQHIRNARYT